MVLANRGGRIPTRKGYDEGGVVGGIGGISAGANPLTQNQYQKFAQMPVEKLQEMAARYPASTSQGQMIQKAFARKPELASAEEALNEVYRQKKAAQ